MLAMLAAAAPAHATPPRIPCLYLPSHASGYRDGRLYAGFGAQTQRCEEHDTPDRFPVLVTLSGLAQLDLGTAGNRLRRAQLAASLQLFHTVHLVGGVDAAAPAVLDAYALVHARIATVLAGRMIAPFGLEAQWSEGNLPFLERSAVTDSLAPARRQHGAALALGVGSGDRRDNGAMLAFVQVGVFRPAGDELVVPERGDAAVIARVFVRRDREQEYKSLDTYWHVGASAAVGNTAGFAERRYAVEADARYYRYRASAEAMVSSVETMTGRSDGHGATITLSATLPVDRERWWTSPLPRYPWPSHHFVSPSVTGEANPGFEVDLGGEAMRTTERSIAAVRVGTHAFFHDYAKLSLAYTFTRGWGMAPDVQHDALVRLQLAF